MKMERGDEQNKEKKRERDKRQLQKREKDGVKELRERWKALEVNFFGCYTEILNLGSCEMIMSSD